MAERPSWAAMNGDVPILDAESSRLALAALWAPAGATAARTGRRPGGGDPLRVSASFPTPDARVHVAPGQSVLAARRGRGEYITTLDASKTIDVLTEHPADSANERWDLIIEQQSDTFYGDPTTGYVIRHLVGTPSQQPRDPEVDGSPDFELLARIRVPAQTTGITGDLIQDLRPGWTVALGGVLPVRSLDERDAIPAPYEGLTVWRIDKGWQETRTGNGWRIVGVPTVSTASEVTHPYLDQIIMLAGTPYRWDGGAWLPLGTLAGRIIAAPGFVHTGIVNATTVTRLAIAGVRITAGRLYELNLAMFGNITAQGTSMGIRVLFNNNVIQTWPWLCVVGGFDDYKRFSLPWRATQTDTNARFDIQVARNQGGGTGSMSIYGDRRTAFWINDDLGSVPTWVEVT